MKDMEPVPPSKLSRAEKLRRPECVTRVRGRREEGVWDFGNVWAAIQEVEESANSESVSSLKEALKEQEAFGFQLRHILEAARFSAEKRAGRYAVELRHLGKDEAEQQEHQQQQQQQRATLLKALNRLLKRRQREDEEGEVRECLRSWHKMHEQAAMEQELKKMEKDWATSVQVLLKEVSSLSLSSPSSPSSFPLLPAPALSAMFVHGSGRMLTKLRGQVKVESRWKLQALSTWGAARRRSDFLGLCARKISRRRRRVLCVRCLVCWWSLKEEKGRRKRKEALALDRLHRRICRRWRLAAELERQEKLVMMRLEAERRRRTRARAWEMLCCFTRKQKMMSRRMTAVTRGGRRRRLLWSVRMWEGAMKRRRRARNARGKEEQRRVRCVRKALEEWNRRKQQRKGVSKEEEVLEDDHGAGTKKTSRSRATDARALAISSDSEADEDEDAEDAADPDLLGEVTANCWSTRKCVESQGEQEEAASMISRARMLMTRRESRRWKRLVLHELFHVLCHQRTSRRGNAMLLSRQRRWAERRILYCFEEETGRRRRRRQVVQRVREGQARACQERALWVWMEWGAGRWRVKQEATAQRLERLEEAMREWKMLGRMQRFCRTQTMQVAEALGEKMREEEVRGQETRQRLVQLTVRKWLMRGSRKLLLSFASSCRRMRRARALVEGKVGRRERLLLSSLLCLWWEAVGAAAAAQGRSERLRERRWREEGKDQFIVWKEQTQLSLERRRLLAMKREWTRMRRATRGGGGGGERVIWADQLVRLLEQSSRKTQQLILSSWRRAAFCLSVASSRALRRLVSSSFAQFAFAARHVARLRRRLSTLAGRRRRKVLEYAIRALAAAQDASQGSQGCQEEVEEEVRGEKAETKKENREDGEGQQEQEQQEQQEQEKQKEEERIDSLLVFAECVLACFENVVSHFRALGEEEVRKERHREPTRARESLQGQAGGEEEARGGKQKASVTRTRLKENGKGGGGARQKHLKEHMTLKTEEDEEELHVSHASLPQWGREAAACSLLSQGRRTFLLLCCFFAAWSKVASELFQLRTGLRMMEERERRRKMRHCLFSWQVRTIDELLLTDKWLHKSPVLKKLQGLKFTLRRRSCFVTSDARTASDDEDSFAESREGIDFSSRFLSSSPFLPSCSLSPTKSFQPSSLEHSEVLPAKGPLTPSTPDHPQAL
ncbi:hypothetical protein GUITHDRAFT_142399 [Guillardia theta CCMP2712]|uniref:Sfi1 spindle body domain-containing protein n=1 Tax=Guillardia theta (strain CCMP2712) TaxID=905079 RepID=L1IXQ1_GUITC|nr:hypothetical protein GUITHDRAFT_142399 [Guillardia theta CCMP2712]EKX41011.1 hypothetical protein GUITHDRAFT_142399 [Guillardia theta CCMP2712]|eukprot:XP_005827991.1 hypothetical protein GUITHDRAFT_142399 [Guillardia theta CCMP2712]